MEHFEDRPFNEVHRTIREALKVHHWNLTRLEIQMITYASNIIHEVHMSAQTRHYDNEEARRLAEETAAVL